MTNQSPITVLSANSKRGMYKCEKTCEYQEMSHGCGKDDRTFADAVEKRFTVKSQQEPHYSTQRLKTLGKGSTQGDVASHVNQ